MSDVDWARRCLSPLWTHGPQTRMGRGPGSRVTWLCITYSDRPAIDAGGRGRRPGSAAGRPDRGADRDAALYAEVRAMLFGRAVPGGTDSVPAGEMVRLTDAAERDRRSDDDGVGRAAARPRCPRRSGACLQPHLPGAGCGDSGDRAATRRRAAGGVRRVRPHRRRRGAGLGGARVRHTSVGTTCSSVSKYVRKCLFHLRFTVLSGTWTVSPAVR